MVPVYSFIGNDDLDNEVSGGVAQYTIIACVFYLSSYLVSLVTIRDMRGYNETNYESFL